ncbi:rhamnulokinase [Paludifilum halophilum]|uniref:Rhamnulokinase n=1 Tax=Paludifilum halophilum TaxID=1642702 RepID=A0A235B4F1_9BACL|nr:rhamnulokinase family protein [Paludifilum halophilum]OYD07153.1 rhamnulokinase [Paludifilum halophilum]
MVGTTRTAWKGLAVDLGASSGRVLTGEFDGERLNVGEVHRFENKPVSLLGTLYWDLLHLYQQVLLGIGRVRKEDGPIVSLGVDSWAVDYGLLDRSGHLLSNPVHYRDRRTEGIMEKVGRQIPREEIFRQTGIQFLPFNTLCQLSAMRETGHPHLEQAHTLLMIPDLFHYFLTGEKVTEFTNATTTQLYDPTRGTWSRPLLDRMDIPRHLFTGIVPPGTELGRLLPLVSEELGGMDFSVVSVATHDTGSAVAAVPSSSDSYAYLSCGTWSLLGTEVNQPVLSERALSLNFTNEGGVEGSFRLLKNIMGLWLLQEIKREWEREGVFYTWDELMDETGEAEPFTAFIDPDDPQFLAPGGMSGRIRESCRRSGQPIPDSNGALIRTVTESLVMKYRWVLNHLEELVGKKMDVLHMVGGGIQNERLCQWTADACGRPVIAGPIESSGAGNLIVQLMAAKEVASLSEGRELVARSFPRRTYEPSSTTAWNEAYDRFQKVLQSG